jgi:hypothetical protein
MAGPNCSLWIATTAFRPVGGSVNRCSDWVRVLCISANIDRLPYEVLLPV